jgi:hypothetical protein
MNITQITSKEGSLNTEHQEIYQAGLEQIAGSGIKGGEMVTARGILFHATDVIRAERAAEQSNSYWASYELNHADNARNRLGELVLSAQPTTIAILPQEVKAVVYPALEEQAS